MTVNDAESEKQAVEYFRKLVSFLYREIGAMRRDNHPEIFDRSGLDSSGFAKQRKQAAKRIYLETLSIHDPAQIVSQYQQRTGLSLEDVYLAFEDGDWLLGARHHSFGGPKWARIAEEAMRLGGIIRERKWERVAQVIAKINDLCHNKGRIIDKFAELG